MKNKFLLLYIIILHNFTFAQNKDKNEECSCNVLLSEKQKRVALFDDNRTVIHYIMNDTINEDYFVMNIKKIKHNLAFVEASAILYDTISKFGWIEVQYIEVYLSANSPINLYKKANYNSAIKSIITNPAYFSKINILDCNSSWLYINFLDSDGKIKEGWLSPENQCADPYSICGG